MTCSEVQERLFELVGAGELPGVVAGHLQMCAECRSIFDELSAIADHLRVEGPFALNDFERHRLLQGIEAGIDGRERAGGRGLTRRLQWVLPVAAAVVLLIGIALLDQSGEGTFMASLDSLLVGEVEPGSAELALYDDLDESVVRVLLQDFSARPASEPSELLLDDLTEDEYEYLARNFDVGEIL